MYGRFQCKSCDVNFVDENSLENTLKNSILLGVNTLIKSLAIKIVLISMYSKLMLPITKKIDNVCNICIITFKYTTDLKEHLTKEHSQSYDYCNLSFNTTSLFCEHAVGNHNFECKLCNEIMKTNDDLDIYTIIKHIFRCNSDVVYILYQKCHCQVIMQKYSLISAIIVMTICQIKLN